MNKTLMKVFPVHFYIITIAILIYLKKQSLLTALCSFLTSRFIKWTYLRWNKADDSGSRLFSWADDTKKVKLHKEVSLMWGLFQPNPVHSHRQLQSMLYGHGYWLKALCAVINSALDVYPKAFYFSKYPSKSTVFSVVQSEQFSAESLAFLTFITTAPGGCITHMKQGFHLLVSHSSPHAVLTPSCAMIQGPAEKSTGVIHLLHVDASALLLLPSLLPYIVAQIWWKETRAELLVLVAKDDFSRDFNQRGALTNRRFQFWTAYYNVHRY